LVVQGRGARILVKKALISGGRCGAAIILDVGPAD
jgi:hypothetical protein